MATILVVDDHDQVRNLLVDYFSDAGYTVFSARDGRQALERMRSAAVDVAMVDLHMPDVHGLETIRQLRQEFPLSSTRIILMSGDYPEIGQEEIEDVSLLVGAHATAYKPFHLRQLLNLVQEQLTLRPYTSHATFYVPSLNAVAH